MGGAYKLGRIAGIDLKIHWTFFLLLAWVGISPLMAGSNVTAAAMNLLLIVAVFESCRSPVVFDPVAM